MSDIDVSAHKLDRIARVKEVRHYGTTEDAENMALSIINAMPNEALGRTGIFATGQEDDKEIGDGGISFQRVSRDFVASVDINPTGDLVDCHRVDGKDYSEAQLSTVAEAAEYLTRGRHA